jgi:hypothetical protein
MLGLDYENRDLAGSAVAAQLYYRDFYTRFAPFDARAVPVRGANVDQSMQNSDVFGGRLTIKTPLGQEKNTLLIWGADFNHERTDMPIDIFDPKAYDASGGLVFNKIGRLIYMPRSRRAALAPLPSCSTNSTISGPWKAERATTALRPASTTSRLCRNRNCPAPSPWRYR